VPEKVVITDVGSDSFRFYHCAAGFGHSLLHGFNTQQKVYSLFAFGLNDCGQLGLGDFDNRNQPCRIDFGDQRLSENVAVSCGKSHTLVLFEGTQSEVGAIYCFGKNQYQLFGPLFPESCYSLPIKILPPHHSPSGSVGTKFIAAGKTCNVFVSTENKMSVVGFIAGPGKVDEDNEPTSGLFSVLLQNVHPQAKEIDIKGLSVADEHCIVLCEDNDYEKEVPLLMRTMKDEELARAKSASERYLHHRSFLPSHIECTGASAGNQSQLDDHDDESSLGSFLIDVPEVDPQLEDASQFEGAIVTWGCNDDYQMGTTGYSFPFATEQASQYLVQKSEQMFMKPEWGSVGCSPCLLNHRGWGMRDVVMVSCGTQCRLSAAFRLSVTIRSGTKHSVAVCGRGDVWVWGSNEFGQLGLGDFEERKTPVRDSSNFSKKSMVACAAGTNHTLLLSDVGKVFSFGDNREGQLGLGWIGQIHPEKGPITCVPDIVHRIKQGRVGQISAGRGHSLALSEYGGMWAWGCNADGQLGCGIVATDPKLFPLPKDVDFSKCAPPGCSVQVKSISCGFDHCLALTHPINNAGQCIPVSWGLNASGQLGHGDLVSRDWPKVIAALAGRDIISAFAGADTSGVIDRVGQLYVWGGNDSYNLGSGDQVRSSLPVRCTSEAFPPEGVKSVSFAKHHTMLLSRKNRVYTWGLNDAGQLGQPTMNRSQVLGPKTYVKHPMKVGFLSRITTVACARKHSIAVVPMPPITGILQDFELFLTLKRYMNAILQRMPDEVLAFELGKMRRDAFVSKLKARRTIRSNIFVFHTRILPGDRRERACGG
jgi:alpha-tubulin suppressor-like RCC1 family protein